MSRIYDALKRAAEQAKHRQAPAAPPPVEGVAAPPQDAPRPTETAAASPSPAPAPPAPAAEQDPLLASLKADIADRVRVETWLRLEGAALQGLGIGRLPRGGGVSAWVLEALGGIAFGTLVASVSVLSVFLIVIWLMHIRIPQLFW